MSKFLRIPAGLFLIGHGIAHFMATSVYWKLSESEEFVYDTAVLGGRLDLGETGIWIYGLLWAIAGIGTIAAGAGLLRHARRTATLLLWITLFSLALCVLVAEAAIIGIAINVAILVILAVLPRLPFRPAQTAHAR